MDRKYVFFIIIILIIRLLITIGSFHFLHKVYLNTVINPFHFSFGFEEKKRLFKDKDTNQLNINSRCKAYEELIMDARTQKLGDIFELKYSELFSCSHFLIAFLIYDIFRSSLSIITLIITEMYESFRYCGCGILLFLVNTIQYYVLKRLDIVYLVYFIFFIYAIYSFYSGDTNDYYNFLFCKNVNYEEFDKYSIVLDVKYDFKYYMILEIISPIIYFIVAFLYFAINQINQ